MLLTLWTLSLPVFAETRTFGGAEVGMECEIDAAGAAALLDVSVMPVKVADEGTVNTFGPVRVAYDFLDMSLDRADLVAWTYQKRIQDGNVRARAIFGRGAWDGEEAFVEVAPVGGVVDVRVAPGTRVSFGGDVHYRYVAATEGDVADFFSWSHELFIGLPVGVTWATRPESPFYAENDLVLRPNLRLAGATPFAFDLEERIGGGYALAQGEDFAFKVGAAYTFRLDTGVWDNPALTHRFWAGVSAAF